MEAMLQAVHEFDDDDAEVALVKDEEVAAVEG